MIPPIIENATGNFPNALSHGFYSWMGWTNELPKVSGRYWLRYFYAIGQKFSEALICDFDADEEGGGKAVRVFHDGSKTEVARNMYFWPEPITQNYMVANTMTISDLQRARLGLEVEMTESMSASLRRFQEKYRFSPDRITVDLQNVQMLGDARPKFVGCTVSVEIKV